MVRSHLGILEPSDYYGEVTGTIVMMSKQGNEGKTGPDNTEYDDGLKRTAEGIVLHPQPRNDPNDPLNWPVWRRDMALAVIGFHSFMIGGQTAILASAFTSMSEEFGVTTSKLAYLVGAYMLVLGFGSVVFAPLAVKFGKRAVYLVALVVWIAGAIWAGASHSYESLLGARIIMGFGGSPTEALPSASIAEIYFQHERAYRLGIYTLLMLGGKNLLPMIAGFIIKGLSWNWLFWIQAIFVGMNLVLTFLFVPETFWNRDPVPDARSVRETERAREARVNSLTSHLSVERRSRRSQPETETEHEYEHGSKETKEPHDYFSNFSEHHARTSPQASRAVTPGIEEAVSPNKEKHANFEGPDTEDHTEEKQERHPKFAEGVEEHEAARPGMAHRGFSIQSYDHRYRRTMSMSSANNPKKPYLDTLKIYNGIFSKDAFWQIALRPFVLFLYPNVLFSIVTYAMSVVWLITISEVVSDIFTAEPYKFPDTSVGLLYVSMFLGGCIGSAIAGRASDIIVRALTRRNNGIYEPEFRLLMIGPVMITTVMGLMAFGWSSWAKDHWIVPAVFLGFLGFGCSLGSTTAITYAVDSYKMFAAEALVSLNLTKNVMGFLFSLFVPKFNDGSGSKWTYLAFGIIQIFLCSWTIPLYIYGKRIRHWTDKAQLMRALYADTDEDEEGTSP